MALHSVYIRYKNTWAKLIKNCSFHLVSILFSTHGIRAMLLRRRRWWSHCWWRRSSWWLCSKKNYCRQWHEGGNAAYVVCDACVVRGCRENETMPKMPTEGRKRVRVAEGHKKRDGTICGGKDTEGIWWNVWERYCCLECNDLWIRIMGDYVHMERSSPKLFLMRSASNLIVVRSASQNEGMMVRSASQNEEKCFIN